MKIEYSNTPTVPYEEAKKRAIAYMGLNRNRLLPAHWIAGAIWPGHRMMHQGAGGAASRILHRMQKEGLVRWRSQFTTLGTWCGSGWELTEKI